MSALGPKGLPVYVAAVVLSGTALAVASLAQLPLVRPVDLPLLVLFVVLLALSEMRPVEVVRDGESESVSLSGVFACALLMHWDLGLAVAVQTCVTLLHGAVHGVAWWKRSFNVTQYAWALSSAAWVYTALVPDRTTSADTRHLLAGMAAVCAYVLVNHTLMSGAIALLERIPLRVALTEDLAFQASLNGASAVLAPLTLVVGEANVLLVPALLLPLAALQRAAVLARREEHRSRHDPLTGLAHGQRFRTLVAQGCPGHTRAAVLVVDVDQFSEVNDTLGHETGDRLLVLLAARLQALTGEHDVLARFGADRFALLRPGLDDGAARVLAEQVRAVLGERYDLESLSFELRVSVGVAAGSATEVEELLQHAEVALGLAKRGGAAVESYDRARDWHSPRRLRLLGELRQAIDERALEVHYQPKVALRTGELVGFEALLRWPHPEFGRVPPEEFVSLAERSGLIRGLTRFVLGEAVRSASGWRDRGVAVPVAVNVSARDLGDPDLVPHVLQLLRTWCLPADALVLEITETALMHEPEPCIASLAALRGHGVKVSMDDFGTGYASLALLRRLPLDEIKIDRVFVADLDTRPGDDAIVRTVVDLARNLGLSVVAEGVEREAVWRRLAELGCDSAQGYLVGRPTGVEHLRLAPYTIPAPRSGGVVSLLPRVGG